MSYVRKTKPILFSTPMIQALLEGRKTQTRRIVNNKWLPIVEECLRVNGKWVWETIDFSLTTPYGKVGDLLWVRETFFVQENNEEVFYRATDGFKNDKVNWRPSIFMPRWASRITLEITDIRVERLQDISEDDAAEEGSVMVAPDYLDGNPNEYRETFKELIWKKINGADSWENNPWVWCVTFLVINKNILEVMNGETV